MSDITHYDGCWRDPKHHACAVREIEQLHEEIAVAERVTGKLMEEREQLSHEIERLHDQLQIRAGHVLDLERKATQRGARMQLMRESMSPHSWDVFCKFHPGADEWFDEDGVPL